MTYQQAKARVESLSPFAFIRPDSLTKRGDTLIARRVFAPRHRELIGLSWAASVRQLFPEAQIVRTDVDRTYNARCWLRFE